MNFTQIRNKVKNTANRSKHAYFTICHSHLLDLCLVKSNFRLNILLEIQNRAGTFQTKEDVGNITDMGTRERKNSHPGPAVKKQASTEASSSQNTKRQGFYKAQGEHLLTILKLCQVLSQHPFLPLPFGRHQIHVLFVHSKKVKQDFHLHNNC